MLLSLAGPLAYSFVRPVSYYKKWFAVVMASLAMMVLFIPWDMVFTELGVWWFNPHYITGTYIASLPVEEWLFFIIIPFACVFVYDILNHYLPMRLSSRAVRLLYGVFGLLCMVLAVVYQTRLYTVTAASLASILAFFTVWRNPEWAGKYIRLYLLVWLPFLIVNGALTGVLTDGAIVNYNPEENMGLRIMTIPVEDGIYNFSMLYLVVGFYEYFSITFDKKQEEN